MISEGALRGMYLKLFEITIKEASPWTVVTAYNKVNGCHADSHRFLLEKVLRGDWGGTDSTVDSLNAGLDLEMPGPTRLRKHEAVIDAVKNGEISEDTINVRVRNILELIEKVGGFRNLKIPPERSMDNLKHRELIREVAGQGLVLLKNDRNVLPLRIEKTRGERVALLGLAKEALIHGGGSASLHTHYRISPWQGMHSTYGEGVRFKFAKGKLLTSTRGINMYLPKVGTRTYRLLPPLAANCIDAEGKAGWTLQFFEHGNYKKPVQTVNDHKEASFNPTGDMNAKFRDINSLLLLSRPKQAHIIWDTPDWDLPSSPSMNILFFTKRGLRRFYGLLTRQYSRGRVYLLFHQGRNVPYLDLDKILPKVKKIMVVETDVYQSANIISQEI
jgi:beta-glucosidase